MNRKHYRAVIGCAVFILLFSFSFQLTAEAASKTETAVKNAEKAADALTRVTSLPKATGKNIPEKEYSAANTKYKTAKNTVKKLASSKTKTNYQNRLKQVNTRITRGKNYINAVKGGKMIDSKRNALAASLEKRGYDTKTHAAYLALSATLKSQSAIVIKVYGATTLSKVKALYLSPAEK